ncbi:MAG: hypothetical protein RLZZ304_388, partial [Actinomycetota bacterium]
TAEVVFAAGIAVAVGQETLSERTTIGGLLMVAAMLIVEWPSRRRQPAVESIAADPLTH